MMISIVTTIAIVAFIIFAICRFLGPSFQSWFRSSGEEKIGLSKDKLYNANGYIVHSGSDILLGSTGSFKRFDSVDKNAHEGELIYGQTALSTPPWMADETIPPQPLRPAPLPSTKSRDKHFVYKQESETKATSAPLKSVPRPIARKQLSAPAASCLIPQINPPDMGIQKTMKDVQGTTNPFLNGLLNFESIKTNFFSTTVTTECERSTKSAVVSKNPFKTSFSGDSTMFDFNANTIKSIMEETPDDGYLGDDDDNDEADPLKRLEQRIQKLEAKQLDASGNRRKSGSGTSPRFSPKAISNKPPAKSESTSQGDVTSTVNEKFIESSIYDESVAKSYRKHIRNRSLSENNENNDLSVLAELDDYVDQVNTTTFAAPSSSTNPFLNGKRLLKTPSETYLEQYSMMRANQINNAAVNCKPLQLCKHPSLTKILQTSQPLFEINESSQSSSAIKRAASSESISSESSVIFNKLERTTPPVTGNLCIALQYDKNSATEEGCELLVTVLEAKDLRIPAEADPDYVDTFVRVYLVPDESEAMQTKVFKNSKHPSYQELFGFFITKQIMKRSLWFHLYHTNAQCTTLIGETEMKLTDIRKPLTTWLQLSDSRHNGSNFGEIMFSLSFLPTAERLTVVVVKARNLHLESDETDNKHEIQNVFVKVYLLKDNKKVSKKRTSTKRGERNPVFNEALSYSVPPFLLNSIQVRLTVMNAVSTPEISKSKSMPVGHVIVGSRTDGKGLLHWHQMITTLRKPIAMFHPLRRSTSKV